jgi:hypothetical protein
MKFTIGVLLAIAGLSVAAPTSTESDFIKDRLGELPGCTVSSTHSWRLSLRLSFIFSLLSSNGYLLLAPVFYLLFAICNLLSSVYSLLFCILYILYLSSIYHPSSAICYLLSAIFIFYLHCHMSRKLQLLFNRSEPLRN